METGKKYYLEDEIYTPLEKESLFEKDGGTYSLVGDFLIPNEFLEEEQQIDIGKWGRMRLEYIKSNKKALYSALFLDGNLIPKMAEFNKSCEEIEETMIEQLKKKREITEHLKKKDQMLWVQEMNNIKDTVEEIIRDEMVYR
ncbi:TnpV protein [Acetoanaerobium pronyense]|uniref:TnpV protein n=1 Tax=Acetoanaerobium pronyense TaxID=1482736 RepID=UPI0038CC1962